MSDGVQNTNMTEEMGTDTPMAEQLEKGKGKASIAGQGEQMHDDEEESSEDDEVRAQGCTTYARSSLTLFAG